MYPFFDFFSMQTFYAKIFLPKFFYVHLFKLTFKLMKIFINKNQIYRILNTHIIYEIIEIKILVKI